MPKIMTKAEESAIVDQIESLINQTEANSYVRFAFAGCLRMARENIEFDFANSYPDMIEFKDKQISECRRDAEGMQKRITELDGKLKKMAESYEDMCKIAENNGKDSEEWEKQAHDVSTMYCKLEKECADKDAEILCLKAEIYDLRNGAWN